MKRNNSSLSRTTTLSGPDHDLQQLLSTFLPNPSAALCAYQNGNLRSSAAIIAGYLFASRNGYDTRELEDIIQRRLSGITQHRHARAFFRMIIFDQGENARNARLRSICRASWFQFKRWGADIALALDYEINNHMDFTDLVNSERLYVSGGEQVCAKNLLRIPFHERAFGFYMQEGQRLLDDRDKLRPWPIPPCDLSRTRVCYVPLRIFVQRLSWLVPENLIHELRHAGWEAVIGGSSIPLCALNHGDDLRMESEDTFLLYVDEVYHRRSVDIFLIGEHTGVEGDFVQIAQTFGYQVVADALTWTDDWDRQGTTHYLRHPRSRNCLQIIDMRSAGTNTAFDIIARNHLPFVRAWYDGETLFVTPVCLASWITRFTNDPPFFGRRVSRNRRARFVCKYAMRGFGFGPDAVNGIDLPRVLTKWFAPWTRRCLPWYHPAYNPAVWHRVMSGHDIEELLRWTSPS